ncbi:hypothetical protein [Halomarina rubra]|uniref:Uncharacterized protein n=1 Tax=Halomarina rubra TaxID=2071873 RepID=A0ABD6ASE9_9EURY|nr:hypothetical protein [Halomarina rubra]
MSTGSPSSPDGGDFASLWRYQLRRAMAWFAGFFVLTVAISGLTAGTLLSALGGLLALLGAATILPVTRGYVESWLDYTFGPGALAVVTLLAVGVVALTFPTG